ncbi:uncharacterized protein LOC125863945 [Solanum stenotomum]|uniref:uncharacterized protein LOC125863945 n=1 Tax=Solanum stenotomum TaxID=172797 RepID=UPI0020D0CAC5|nr:uncharacterized protein LOC125863945 [Solanum stenotomum]
MTNSSQVNVGTVSAATTSVAHNPSTAALAPAKKTAIFFGVHFKRWQQKMFFYLTVLSLQRLISENIPIQLDETSNEGLFLDALKKKYETKDAGIKKFIVVKFLDYKMIDNKTVVIQVQELRVIIHDLLVEGLIVNDAFQVAVIIEKLPLLWKNLKNYLKHKCKEMVVEDLMVRLRIEEDNKAAEKRSCGNSAISEVNVVEEDPTKSRKRKKAFGPKNNPPKKKFNGNCFNCGKRGHKATKCRGHKKDRRRIKQIRLNSKTRWTIFVQCFQNVTWLEI